MTRNPEAIVALTPPNVDPASLDAVLAGVLRGSWLGVVLLAPDGRLRWANLAAAALLGGQPETLQGRGLRSFFTEDEAQQPALERLEACLASGEALHPGFELQLRGAPRWLRLELQRLPPEQRAAQQLGGALALIDVTEQRRLREEAGREGQLLREAARLGHIGAWDFDYLAYRLRWSEETFAIHDLPPGAEPDPEAALAFYDDSSQRRVRAAMREALIHGTPFDLPLSLVSATGQAKRVRLIGSAQCDQGRVVRVAGLFHDITEREQHAQALLDKAAAESASRAKSEFLSRVSHELRTPLNGVLGFAQLLQHRAGELPGWTAEPLRLIRQAGDHLLTLIDDMLDLGSIESGAPRLTLRAVALDAVVGEALRLVAPQALAAGVVLRPWTLNGAWVEADPTRLRQVLLNLLSNAIKYNRPGGDVRLLQHEGPEGLTLRIIDSGTGISAERRRELFQPFNRLGAEGGAVPGSGLGLTIARHLAEAMGGRLELAPAPPAGAPAGTEMRVVLRRADPAPAAAAPPAVDAAADGAGTCHVLYVEDHPVNAMLVREALAVQQPRHRLRIAETGEEGLAMVAEERPDVVLLDLNLPGADGYAVLAQLRADAATAGLPCVAVSADAMPEEVARARAAGFDDYWTKPLAMIGLAERIAAIAASGSARAPG
ncbi:response regulator [Aquincola sp. S2]|uniref:histidine kinase n=1 Tax=Pseudaquabacterium terrae TaxID=2732868 RepID=A0ABX2EKU3_9BURK|nr:ATP-binding protein [Aquabacterium terrae]NRF69224.1 response regulator [Aquabacterium terrae]